MSSISSLDKALDYEPQPKLRAGLWHHVTTVGSYWSAILGGLAAARAYNELTARGVPHEVAVETVFDRHLNAG